MKKTIKKERVPEVDKKELFEALARATEGTAKMGRDIERKLLIMEVSKFLAFIVRTSIKIFAFWIVVQILTEAIVRIIYA